jgi:hypothetical protein
LFRAHGGNHTQVFTVSIIQGFNLLLEFFQGLHIIVCPQLRRRLR